MDASQFQRVPMSTSRLFEDTIQQVTLYFVVRFVSFGAKLYIIIIGNGKIKNKFILLITR